MASRRWRCACEVDDGLLDGLLTANRGAGTS
jgi:hypothetical protein